MTRTDNTSYEPGHALTNVCIAGRSGWTASCACGWRISATPTRDRAELLHAKHTVAALRDEVAEHERNWRLMYEAISEGDGREYEHLGDVAKHARLMFEND